MSPHEIYAVERALLQRFYSNLPRSEARLSPRMIASGNSCKSVISIAVLWRSADGLRACVKCGFGEKTEDAWYQYKGLVPHDFRRADKKACKSPFYLRPPCANSSPGIPCRRAQPCLWLCVILVERYYRIATAVLKSPHAVEL